jgi:predicted nucleotidyltransferase
MLFDLSKKIDELLIEALREIKKTADTLGISFFVVGATARDIILKHCYEIEPPRMTRDIDLGVEVESWELFNRLINSLVSTGKFAPTNEVAPLCTGHF